MEKVITLPWFLRPVAAVGLLFLGIIGTISIAVFLLVFLPITMLVTGKFNIKTSGKNV